MMYQMMTKTSLKTFIDRSYEANINEELLRYSYDYPVNDVKNYIYSVCSIPLDEFIKYIENTFPRMKMQKSDFAQFGNSADATINLCKKLKEKNGDGVSAYDIGCLLLPSGKKREAYRKFGEGNAKAATDLGFLSCFGDTYFLACLGKEYPSLEPDIQNRLLSRQVIRTKEFRQLIVEIHISGYVNIRNYMGVLSESTYQRRRSTFVNLYKMLQKDPDYDFNEINSKIIIP